MKQSICLALSCWLLVGCMKPIPPEPVPPVVIEVRPTPIHSIAVELEVDAAPPIKTWLSKEEWEALRLQQAIEKAAQEDPCQKGDPLCDHIPTSP